MRGGAIDAESGQGTVLPTGISLAIFSLSLHSCLKMLKFDYAELARLLLELGILPFRKVGNSVREREKGRRI